MLPHFLGLYETGKALIDAGVIPNRNEPVFFLYMPIILQQKQQGNLFFYVISRLCPSFF